ncbi:MAG: hypothetical protein Kow0029_03210 [Candidatus Rifleibacteriota bacterium]
MKFTFSLSFQIAVFFTLISMLAVVGSGTLSYLESRNLIEKQFEKSMGDIATTIGGSLNNKVESAAESILRIAEDDRFVLEDNAKIQEFIRIVVKSSTLFNNIYYFSPEGPILAAAYSDGRDVTKYGAENFMNYSESEKTSAVYESLIKAKETQAPVYASFFKSATDRLMNTFIVPVVRDGEVKGLLSCAIALDSSSKLLDMMRNLKPHPKGFIALTSSQGNIVISAGDLPEELASYTLVTADETKLQKNAGYIQAFRSMGKTGLGIVVGIPESVILDLLVKLRYNTIFYTLGVGLFASILGILVASFLTAPLSLLVDGLNKLKNGERVPRINCRASGEIAAAIFAFNELSEKLRKEIKLQD